MQAQLANFRLATKPPCAYRSMDAAPTLICSPVGSSSQPGGGMKMLVTLRRLKLPGIVIALPLLAVVACGGSDGGSDGGAGSGAVSSPSADPSAEARALAEDSCKAVSDLTQKYSTMLISLTVGGVYQPKQGEIKGYLGKLSEAQKASTTGSASWTSIGWSCRTC